MILTCPDCSTRYHVDTASLGPQGRAVRCANCGSRWTARPPDDTPHVVGFLPATSPKPHRRPGSRADAPPAAGSNSLVGWLLAMLVVLVAAGAVIGRNEIVAAFPASAGVYQKLGLPVTMKLDLQFENVTSERISERGISILVVEGEVVNRSDQVREVPPVRITLLDDGGRQLQHELFEAEDTRLEPDARTAFTARVVNPTEQARNFSITFNLN
ncbi:MAG TPA: DUF3426 domain-containing protein [Geminicoccaceae bacterium]